MVLVTTFRSDVRVVVTLFFVSSLYIHCSLSRWVHEHWVFRMVGFLCHLLIILKWIVCSSSDFHPAMPTQYCNLPYVSVMYWKLYMSCMKIFHIFCRYLCEMFGVVLLVTFIMPMIYALLIAVVVVVSYLCVYQRCWVATYAYSWITIYRGWTNNGNTRQYRNKTVCVGCTERTVVLSFIIILFVCLCCVVPVSVDYRLCYVTVCMKVLQNGRLLRFSKRTVLVHIYLEYL